MAWKSLVQKQSTSSKAESQEGMNRRLKRVEYDKWLAISLHCQAFYLWVNLRAQKSRVSKKKFTMQDVFSKLEQDFEIVNFVQVWILMKNTAGGQQQECLWEAEIQKLVLPNFFCIFWWGQQKSEASLYIFSIMAFMRDFEESCVSSLSSWCC